LFKKGKCNPRRGHSGSEGFASVVRQEEEGIYCVWPFRKDKITNPEELFLTVQSKWE